MGSSTHFETVAATYASARPPYPDALYAVLEQAGAIGAGRRVLEIGAGTGQATTALLERGCTVTAIEPGQQLAERLRATASTATVLHTRIEDAPLPPGAFDTVVAATSMHWVDLPPTLRRLHHTLSAGGFLAVWRTIFGDPRVTTPFRTAVARITAQRPRRSLERVLDPRPTVDELEAGGWFAHEQTWSHAWHIDLSVDQIRRLFATFSDWTLQGLDALESAAREAGPVIREHYITHLHMLRRR